MQAEDTLHIYRLVVLVAGLRSMSPWYESTFSISSTIAGYAAGTYLLSVTVAVVVVTHGMHAADDTIPHPRVSPSHDIFHVIVRAYFADSRYYNQSLNVH